MSCNPGFSELDIYLALKVKVDCTSDLLQRANSRRNNVQPCAAQENRTILVGVAFKNRHDIDKALERSKFKNSGNLCVLPCRRFAVTVETRRGVFLRWTWVDDSYGVMNDRAPCP